MWAIRTIVILALIGYTVTAGTQVGATELSTRTSIYCSNPEVPSTILTVAFPQDVAAFGAALGAGKCHYSEASLPIAPLYLVRKVKAHPTAAEPYGYIWAIRLPGQKLSYWFFWLAEHEEMHKQAPGI